MKAFGANGRGSTTNGADAGDEVAGLRRTIRDLVALSSLPSIWVDCQIERSLQNLTDVLRATLRAVTVCVRVELPDGSRFETSASERLSNNAPRTFHAGELLDAVPAASQELVSLPCFNGTGPINALSHAVFAAGRQIGHFVACFREDVFPQENERLILHVAANQIALLLQRHKAQEEHFAELKHAEQAARASEARLKGIVENTPECIKLVAQDGTLLAMNEAGLVMVEADSAECVLGKNIYDVIAPEYRSAFRAMNERVCAGHKDRLEFEIVGLKGTRRWMETHAAPIVDPTSGRTVQLGVTRNITERRNAELEIRRKNKQLAAFLETAAVGLHRVGPDGTILWANDAEMKMLGYSREEYIGHHISQFHADEPVINDILKRLTCAERLYDYEARLKCKDGSIKTVLIDSSVLWEDGRFVHTQCFTRDITQKKQTENALRENERRLHELVEALPAAIYTTDAQGRITMFNQAAVEFSGRVPRIGSDSWCVTWKMYWPDGRPLPHDECPMAIALKEGRPVRGCEAVAERPDGTRINFIPYPTPLRDSRGRIVGAINMLVDITERKRAEDALRESKALLEGQKDAFQEAMRGGSLEESLQVLVHKAIELTGGHGRAAFYITGPDSKALHHVVGMDEHYAKCIDGYPVSGESMACGLTVYTGQPVIARDVEEDPKWEAYRWLARQHRFRACWSFPVRTKDGPVLGTLAMYFPEPCEPTPREFEFASVIAHAATVIISRHRELKERERAQEALRLSSRLPAENPAPVLRVSRERLLHFANPKAQEFLSEWQALVGDPAPPAIAELIGGGERHDTEITVGGRCYTVAVAPVLDGEFLNLYFTDITGRKRAEQTLREMNERLKKVLEVETVGVMFWDLATGCLVDANDTFLRMMGYSRAEVESRSLTWQKFTPPEYHDISRAEVAKFMATGRVGPYEKEYFHKDGTRQWLLFAGSSLGNNQCVEFCVDISKRKKIEQALRESEERFRSIFNQSTAGIAQVDLNGRFLLVNQRFCDITGYSETELQTKTCTQLTYVADQVCDREMFEKGLRDRKPFFVEKRYVRPDGSLVWVRNNVSQMVDADGKVRRMLAVSVDITEQKRAQESAARLAAIVEHSDDAIFSTDLQGIITSWNAGAQRLYGYSADEVLGKPIAMLLPEGRADEEPGIIRRIGNGETVQNYETERRRKDGKIIDVSLTVSPIKDSVQKIIGASKVARDITDKIRAREKLEQTVTERTASLREAVEQMEEFSYSVSHDLRGPLRAMNAYAGVLLEEYGNRLDDTGRGYLEKIQRSSERMNRLTQDVLAYARVARSQEQPETIDFEQLVRDVIHQHTNLQRPAAEIEIVGPLLTVLGHETTLGQSVSNLLNNAVKFVAPGVKPHVRIRADRSGKNVRVWFEDNGIGIKPYHQERIFNMFERVHPEGKYEGTGIGLTIVRKAVEKMGGRVGVESDGQSGSRFWVELRSAEQN